jgi:amidohydrolase
VTFVFQPAEEGGGGGERMVRDGCLSGQLIGPPVERMFGLHGWPELTVGHAATRIGPMLAAADEIEITVRGMGAHAAYPHYGRDPVLAGAAMVSALQQIASRNVSPLDAVVVSITQFHAGTAHNIIPMTAELNGTVRTLLPQTRALAEERIGHISRSIAQAHGCEAEVAYEHGYPVTRNDAGAAEMFFRVAREALGEARVSELPRPEMGAEDFAYYGEHVPACFFALGVRPVGSTTIPQLHHPAFNFNDDAIAIGVELFCRLALQV